MSVAGEGGDQTIVTCFTQKELTNNTPVAGKTIHWMLGQLYLQSHIAKSPARSYF